MSEQTPSLDSLALHIVRSTAAANEEVGQLPELVSQFREDGNLDTLRAGTRSSQIYLLGALATVYELNCSASGQEPDSREMREAIGRFFTDTSVTQSNPE